MTGEIKDVGNFFIGNDGIYYHCSYDDLVGIIGDPFYSKSGPKV
jgi:hypothetical protein